MCHSAGPGSIKLLLYFFKKQKKIWKSLKNLKFSLSLWLCPRGEIGKRCGLRSRWCNYLGSSSLPVGTVRTFIKVLFLCFTFTFSSRRLIIRITKARQGTWNNGLLNTIQEKKSLQRVISPGESCGISPVVFFY